MRNSQVFRSVLCGLLVFSITYTPVVGTSQTQMKPIGFTSDWPSENQKLRQLSADLAMDPIIGQIGNDRSIRPVQSISSSDPLLDQNPFFLSGQRWVKSGSSVDEEVRVEFRNGQTRVVPAHSTQALVLDSTFVPVLETNEFLIFSAHSDQNVLSRNGRVEGEGLFFLDLGDLQRASQNAGRVPVMHFPMPGSGWVSSSENTVGAFEVPQHDLVVLNATDGDSLPIRLDDLRMISKISHLNLTMGLAQKSYKILDAATRNRGALEPLKIALYEGIRKLNRGTESQAMSGLDQLTDLVQSIYTMTGEDGQTLLPGSTAGFGLLFTGFDLVGGKPWFRSAQISNSRAINAVAGLFDLLIPQAKADVTPEIMEFLHRTSYVFTVVGGIYVSGILARYTVLREKIKQQYANGDTSGWTKKSFDILAHSLTTLFQTPLVMPTHIVEYGLDRARISNNGAIRRLFNNTLGYVRMSNSRTPVNAKTLKYGVGALGAMDTALVAFQFYLLTPGLAWIMVQAAPQFIAERAHAAWMVDNPNMAMYNMLAVMGNMIAYIVSGAYSYAHEVQDITTNDALRIISQQMKEEGKNPDDPSNRRERDRRINEIVRATLKRQGLPGENDFLFDAGSIYRSLQSLLFGYSLPGNATSEEAKDPEQYLAITRQGLNGQAIKSALKFLEEMSKYGPEQLSKLSSELGVNVSIGDVVSAKMLVRDLQNRFSVLARIKNDFKSFLSLEKLIDVAEQLRSVRAELVQISFMGQEDVKELLPERWKTHGSNAAVVAGLSVRTALWDAAGMNSAPEQSQPQREYDHLVVEKGFARWQLKRAIKKATNEYLEKYGIEPELDLANNPKQTAAWEAVLQKHIIRTNGVYPDYQNSELIAEAEALTRADLERLRSTNEHFRSEISRMNAFTASRIQAILLGDFFTTNYVTLTQTKERVPAIDPAQPGILQRVRQQSWVRSSPIWSKFFRAAEAPFSDTAYERGFNNLMKRAFPLGQDLYNGNVRAARTVLSMGSAGYYATSSIWRNNLPYLEWAISYLFRGSTIIGPWATTNRMMTKLGEKPGSQIKSMLKYAAIGSFATFTGVIPYGLFHDDIKNGFKWVGENASLLGGKAIEYAEPIVNFCLSVLGGS